MCKPTDRDKFINTRRPTTMDPSGRGSGGAKAATQSHALHSLIGSIATAYSGIKQSQQSQHTSSYHPPFAVPAFSNTGLIVLPRSGAGAAGAALEPTRKRRSSPNDAIRVDDSTGTKKTLVEPTDVPMASRPRKRIKTDGEEAESKEQKESPSSGKSRRTTRRRRSNGDSSGEGRHHHYHDQGVVKHSYHDHANDTPDYQDSIAELKQKRGGGTNTPFPVVLHGILDGAEGGGYTDIISWQPHGRAFMVHNQDRFVSELMPQFFRQTRFSSFQRQLSLYGFLRLTRKGPDYSGYYHELFLRGKSFLCRKISRTRIKGYWVRQSSSPDTEPDFTNMPPVGGGAVMDGAAIATTTTTTTTTPPQLLTAPRTSRPIANAPRVLPVAAPPAAPTVSAIGVVAEADTPPLGEERPSATASRLQSDDPYVEKVPVSVVTGSSSSSKLPPMPPLDAYRRGIGWPMTVPPIPPAERTAAGGEEEQENLALFLSDVDLDSEDDEHRDGGAYKGEDHMAEIYELERDPHHRNTTV